MLLVTSSVSALNTFHQQQRRPLRRRSPVRPLVAPTTKLFQAQHQGGAGRESARLAIVSRNELTSPPHRPRVAHAKRRTPRSSTPGTWATSLFHRSRSDFRASTSVCTAATHNISAAIFGACIIDAGPGSSHAAWRHGHIPGFLRGQFLYPETTNTRSFTMTANPAVRSTQIIHASSSPYTFDAQS